MSFNNEKYQSFKNYIKAGLIVLSLTASVVAVLTLEVRKGKSLKKERAQKEETLKKLRDLRFKLEKRVEVK